MGTAIRSGAIKRTQYAQKKHRRGDESGDVSIMRLFVQIPCLNEQATLPAVIRAIPRRIEGIDDVKILIIDDGSLDNTVEVARKEGADYVVRLPYNQGLARAFMRGIGCCLELGADIIVNTDGDQQYRGDDIPRLIQPILERQADIVIGDRQVGSVEHFSWVKRILQRLGSRTVSVLSSVRIPDATSGFRAYSREAALRLNVFSQFTYTLETLIQAGKNQTAITYVPVRVNGPTRRSRLFSNIPSYLKRSTATILRIYTLYEPLRTFFYIGGGICSLGMIGLLRYLYFWLMGSGSGHVQSLIASAILLIIGFQVGMLGILADLISVNRRLNEEILYRMKKQELPLHEEHLAVITSPSSRDSFSSR
jgi:glycosyltransferase involved in cell wall biosynthesis